MNPIPPFLNAPYLWSQSMVVSLDPQWWGPERGAVESDIQSKAEK